MRSFYRQCGSIYGESERPGRPGAADLQVGHLVRQLQTDGRWDSTVVLMTADYSMDWSLSNRIVNLTRQFGDDEDRCGPTGVAQNCGAAAACRLRG